MINFMNSSCKDELHVLNVDDKTTMIDLENKVIYKNKYVRTIKGKS